MTYWKEHLYLSLSFINQNALKDVVNRSNENVITPKALLFIDELTGHRGRSPIQTKERSPVA